MRPKATSAYTGVVLARKGVYSIFAFAVSLFSLVVVSTFQTHQIARKF